MLRVIGDSKVDRQKRQKCREEVKLLVGKEVWEDVKRKLRHMQTEQGNSSSEDRTLKKRLRTKHDDVDRNTIQVESAADNDQDPVKNTAANAVTVDTAALTVTDVAGNESNKAPSPASTPASSPTPESSPTPGRTITKTTP